MEMLAGDIRLYAARISGLVAELSSAADSIEAEAADKKYTARTTGNVGFNDFSEAHLRRVEGELVQLADLLPDLIPGEAVSEDVPIPFEVERLADYLEFLAREESPQAVQFASGLAMRLRSMMTDTRLRPLIADNSMEGVSDWLESLLGQGNASQISIIDLSLIPSEVLHVVTSVVVRVIFEAMHRTKKMTGEAIPVVLVLDEAHHFVSSQATTDHDRLTPAILSRLTFERVAREERKFGLGLVVSSQRPSELSPTILSQCNTFLLHRLVNDRDQDLVRRLVPDCVGSMLGELPSLPTQFAILLGWAAPIPLLLQMRGREAAHRPSSSDPPFWNVWSSAESRTVDWRRVSTSWVDEGSGIGSEMSNDPESEVHDEAPGNGD